MEAQNSIPVVILAGGRGSRLGDVTDVIPKPMVEVQGVPMIERIMLHFQRRGFHKFIVSAGYKQEVIRDYFNKKNGVCVVDTGIETQTAGRILGVESYIDTQNFFACYGDGLTDYNPQNLLTKHMQNNAICTLLTIHPTGRFGELDFDSRGLVTRFSEKPIGDKWINGGYFCFSRNVFGYLEKNKVLETDVFSRLVAEKQLFCDSYDGFWHSLDTPKDLAELNEMELP